MDKEKEKRLLREKMAMTSESIEKLCLAHKSICDELNERVKLGLQLFDDYDKLDAK